MDIICDSCFFKFNRDQCFNNSVVEEYKNIYGTICPQCGKRIRGISENIFSEMVQRANQEKMKELTEEMLNKIRESISKEKDNGNT
jgi:predicted small metal-binding protein